MRNAPFTLTAAVMLAVFLCFGNENVWACSECICFNDNTCTNEECGVTPNANCTRYVFTPSCSGNYSFKTSTTCTGGSNCFDCQSCANIFKISGGIEYSISNGNCHTNECDINNCTKDCSATGNFVALSSGVSYAVYVCKIPCPDGPDCDDCGADCKAWACFSYGIANCNP
ncbi:hypothetical protein HUU59_13290 [bacterium]|nr:hypothetical protein [bacterium]